MTTMPPMARVRQKLADWLVEKKNEQVASPSLTPAQYELAGWITPEIVAKFQTYLHSRIEGRGQMPVPSNPHDAVVRLAMDAEARLIMSELAYVVSQPANVINPGIAELDNE